MGIFSKKESCPICGKRIKGDVLLRIKDNITLCRDCSAAVNMDAALIPFQTVEDMEEHLFYRERNQEKFDRFQATREGKAGNFLIFVDEVQKIWYCIRNRKDKNPPIFSYDEIVSYQYLEDGQPVEEEEKKSILGALFGEKKEAAVLHSMKVHIILDNPYTKYIDIEMVPVNEEIKEGSLTYKSYRRALDKIMEIFADMTDMADDTEEDPTETVAEDDIEEDNGVDISE